MIKYKYKINCGIYAEIYPERKGRLKMKKSSLNIETYNITKNDNEYILYLIPESDNSIDIYIQRKQCGIIIHCIGLISKRMDRGIEDVINYNIDKWIEDYDNEIEDIENSRLLKED